MNALAADIAATLLHSTWQVGLVATGYAVVLATVRAVRIRYLLGCIALFLCLAFPLGWLLFTSDRLAAESESPTLADSNGSPRADLPRWGLEYGFDHDTGSENRFKGTHQDVVHGPNDVGIPERQKEHVLTKWLVAVWFTGACAVGLRIPMGLHAATKLQRSARPVTSQVVELADKLRRRLCLQGSVLVSQSEQVLVPCVVGILKPTVLLPSSLMTGLTTLELEALLAHELAHVRRHDCVVNLLQSAAEAVLFYHPAVWWISGHVRREREDCCDDLALTVCCDREAYASALLTLGEVTPLVGIAANGGSLFRRIQRILGETPPTSGNGSVVASICGTTVLALAISTLACYEKGKSDKSSLAPTRENSMTLRPDYSRSNEQIRTHWKRFIDAFEKGGNEAIIDLIKSGNFGVNEYDGQGGSVLTYCAYSGNAPLAQQLVSLGADVNGRHPQDYTTPLHTAAAFNRVTMVSFLTQHGADPNVATAADVEPHACYPLKPGATPLHIAVMCEHVEVVRILLRAGAKLRMNDGDGKSPIDYLGDDGQRASKIRQLFDNRAAYLNRWQISEWQRAIENDDVGAVIKMLETNQTHCVQCLQKFRADGTWYLLDPLCAAARQNSVSIVKAMLDHQRLPNYTVGLGQYNGEIKGAHCLAWAASEEMRQLLLANGADPASIVGIEIPNINERPVPLDEIDSDLGLQWQLAVELCDEGRIRNLLSNHPHLARQVIMERWRDGRMGHRSLDPVYQMAQSGHLAMIKLMIEKGYDKSKLSAAIELAAPSVAAYLVDELGIDGKPDVGLMAYIADTDSLKFWLDRGYPVDDRMLLDACGNRGRFRGYKFDAHTGWPEKFRGTIQVLIDAGADVNARMPGGNEKYDGCEPWRTNRETPLHFSAGSWDPVQVKMLLDAGADKTLTNDLGETPYNWAVKYDAPETTRTLLYIGENAESGRYSMAGNDDDQPPQELRDRLTVAIEANDLDAANRLLEDCPKLANADLRKPENRNVFSFGHPLFIACHNEFDEMAILLLEHGSDADAPGPDPNDRPVHGLPLHLSAADHKNYHLAHILLDHGATPNSYPNCDKSTIERMFYHANEAGMCDVMVRRVFAKFLPDGVELESQSATDLVHADASAAVKLFARMFDLGAQPPFVVLVREGFHDLAMEAVDHSHAKDGTPHDHPNARVIDNIAGAARWYGYPDLVRRLSAHPSFRYSYEDAISTITVAIGSHNRDGDYSKYREIILMQLEALRENGDLERARQDPGFKPIYQLGTDFTWHNNYGYRAQIAEPECYIDLAELMVSWGFDDINFRDPESGHSPLSAAVNRGHHPGIVTFIKWLLERGADLRQSAPDEINPVAIAKERKLDEIVTLLEGFEG